MLAGCESLSSDTAWQTPPLDLDIRFSLPQNRDQIFTVPLGTSITPALVTQDLYGNQVEVLDRVDFDNGNLQDESFYNGIFIQRESATEYPRYGMVTLVDGQKAPRVVVGRTCEANLIFDENGERRVTVRTYFTGDISLVKGATKVEKPLSKEEEGVVAERVLVRDAKRYVYSPK